MLFNNSDRLQLSGDDLGWNLAQSVGGFWDVQIVVNSQ